MREVLVLLAQVSFSMIPPPVHDMVASVFRGWGATLINELGFKTLRLHGKPA